MLRRGLLKGILATAVTSVLPINIAFAKEYLTVEQAKQILFPDQEMTPAPITLTEEQMDAIEELGRVRVRHSKLHMWKTQDGGFFFADNVIGKHENIDIAVGLDRHGKVVGIEVLTYRESYGDQVMHPKWRAQFLGKDSSEHLLLDKQIKNISGATLSCRHLTDGINRLTATWTQVLSKL